MKKRTWRDPKICLGCGKEFIPHTPVHAYCGRKYEKFSCSNNRRKEITRQGAKRWAKAHPEKAKDRNRKSVRKYWAVQNFEKAIDYLKRMIEVSSPEQVDIIKSKIKELL